MAEQGTLHPCGCRSFDNHNIIIGMGCLKGGILYNDLAYARDAWYRAPEGTLEGKETYRTYLKAIDAFEEHIKEEKNDNG